jgi:hypothetical protein
MKILLNQLFSFMLMASCSSVLLAQSNKNLLPNVTGPTPEVAQLAKYGSYDVNSYTGVANIEIPLHTIVAKDIQVPIVLRYHPSGIKVTDRPGWVGLGWSLDAGGFISRQVLGLPDELPEGYANTVLKTSINPSNNDDLHYLNDVNRGLIDTEPDVFSYGFGGFSGKFMLDKLQNSPDANNSVANTGGTYFNTHRVAEAERACDDDDVMLIPYQPLDIQPTYGTSSVGFKAFDPMGREYQFDDYETTKEVNESLNVRSAWKLSKIVSKNRVTEVNFSYQSHYGQVSKDRSYSVAVNDLVQNLPGNSTYTPNPGIYSYQDINMWSTEQYPDSITFPLGAVKFIMSGTREGGFSGQQMLSQIQIFKLADGVYEQIKRIDFVYGTFTSTDGSGTKRSYLEEVIVKTGTGAKVQKYELGYNTTHMLPDFLSTKRDLWGYYNNQVNERNNTPTLVPKHSIDYQPYTTSSTSTIEIGTTNSTGRDPNSTYAKACMLNKITYPTGGYTEFEYEGNSYNENSTTKNGPGLRIKEIRSYTKSGTTPIRKTFEYGDGRANFLSEHYSFDNEINHRSTDAKTSTICCTMRSRSYLSAPNIALEPFDQALVVYPQVSVYEGTLTANTGKTIYDYWDYNDTPGPGFQIGTPTIESNHWRRGQLKQMRSYRFDGGTSYAIVKEQNHNYGGFGLCKMGQMGLKVKKTFYNGGGDAFWEIGSVNTDEYSYLFAYYRVLRGDDKLISTEEILYDEQGNPYATSTQYYYDNYDHLQVTNTVTVDSEGDSITQEYRFAHDVNGTVYTNMENAHQIGFPVIEISYKNGVEMNRLFRKYGDQGNQIYEPYEITIQRKGGTIYTEVDFSDYDSKGNPIEFKGRDGVNRSVIWAYEDEYAVIAAEYVSRANLVTAVNSSLPSGYASLQDLLDALDDLANNGTQRFLWKNFNENLRSHNLMGDAIITTSVYDPTIGMTAATDPSGLTTYYRYDASNRLYQVKDQNNNLLKEYQYHYSN